MIENSLKNETAQIKSQELAKIKLDKFNKDGLEIEVIGDIKAIEINGNYGVELLAKAWKDGKPLGFGKDGIVEIECFRLYTNPTCVEDIDGDINEDYSSKKGGRKIPP